MAAIEVDIAVACGYMQHYEWWTEVFANIIHEVQIGDITIGKMFSCGTALVDNSRNRIVGAWLDEKRQSMTDANRNHVVGINANGLEREDGFMYSPAEWVFWMDDDTVPPRGTIRKLLDLRRELVAGMYFLGGPPYNPLAYVRNEEGFYRPLYKYAYGSLVQVDAVGMGCTLVHKDVYRKIMEAHEVFSRPNASLMPVPKKHIIPHAMLHHHLDNMDLETVANLPWPAVYGSHLVMPLTKPEPDDPRAWPFYAMEYGRTEDLHFGELAQNAGVQIWIDTSINCKHWKTRNVNYQTYREYAEEHDARPEETANT